MKPIPILKVMPSEFKCPIAEKNTLPVVTLAQNSPKSHTQQIMHNQ